jgi:hypothetical protein
VITYPGGITGRLAVFRPAATAGTYTVVGVSSQQAVLGGANSFPTRIPVSGGEQIAMSAPVGSLNCLTSDATDVTAATTPPTDLAAGSTITTGPITTKSRAAVTATIEPDADQDGYGDETQDLCPISAAYQIACPIVKLVKFALPPTASSLKLLLTSSAPAPVSVSGVVAIKLPKSGKKKAKTTKFKVSAALPTVSPGSIATITVKFPKKLTAALKQFSSSQKFKLKLTIVGTGVANVDTSVTTVTLRGTK